MGDNISSSGINTAFLPNLKIPQPTKAAKEFKNDENMEMETEIDLNNNVSFKKIVKPTMREKLLNQSKRKLGISVVIAVGLVFGGLRKLKAKL